MSDTEGNNNVLPEMVPIPAGPFWMGSLPGAEVEENERPRYQVNLPSYSISRYPIINFQYTRFIQTTGHPPPPYWSGQTSPEGLNDHPVIHITYEDAVAYCRWLSQEMGKPFRLPTEEQWEKAARGESSGVIYPWGDSWDATFCNSRESNFLGTTAVHKFADANSSPYGVKDMVGNVWEWTSSWYAPYPGSTHQSLQYGRTHRVVRGGSWNNPKEQARISCRGRYKPDTRRPYLGFRIVSDLEIHSKSSPSISEDTTLNYQLLIKLNKHFDEIELDDLCFELGIDPENLPNHAQGKRAKSLALIVHLQRQERMADLIKICQRRFPHITWP